METRVTMTLSQRVPGRWKIREIQPANQQKASWQIKTVPNSRRSAKEPRVGLESHGQRKWGKMGGNVDGADGACGGSNSIWRHRGSATDAVACVWKWAVGGRSGPLVEPTACGVNLRTLLFHDRQLRNDRRGLSKAAPKLTAIMG